MVTTIFFLLSFLGLTLGNPQPRILHVHESVRKLPSGFQLKGPASPEMTLKLRLALAQSNPSGLIDALMDISTPTSAHYGQHLTKEETEIFTSPTPESYSIVTAWLTDNGISATNLTTNGQWLGFSIPVGEANELLGANFSVYVHGESGNELVRTLSYSVPSDLSNHIALVHPTTAFVVSPKFGLPLVAPRSTRTSERRSDKPTSTDIAASCVTSITPSCLQSLYGIPSTPATQTSNVLAVGAYEEEYANEADLEAFLNQYRPDMNSSTTFTLVSVDGGANLQNSGEAGGEADLDVQYTIGLATDVPVEFISVGFDNPDGISGFLNIINYLIDQPTVPTVLTNSYGFDEDSISLNMATTLCQAYATLGARGTSILFASGDGGVGGAQSESCTDFIAVFPASCPYLTSVGATTGIAPETAAYFSGGGFSYYFPRQDYQAPVVETFLDALGDTYQGLYNASGRAYPDVSAQGDWFETIWMGIIFAQDGTSCSCPTFASVISLVNDRLLAAGKPVLGFLNPWLYSIAASALTDITSGNAPGCNTNGFSAVPGWDPITGLGSPRFSDLLKAAGL